MSFKRASQTTGDRLQETIFKGHQSYNLMMNLQLGILIVVELCLRYKYESFQASDTLLLFQNFRYTEGKITLEPRHEISDAQKPRMWMNFLREGF